MVWVNECDCDCVHVLGKLPSGIMLVGKGGQKRARTVEEEETDDVGCKAEGADDDDELRVGYLCDEISRMIRGEPRLFASLTGSFEESLDGFEGDGKTERKKEDTVHKGSKNFGAMPAV